MTDVIYDRSIRAKNRLLFRYDQKKSLQTAAAAISRIAELNLPADPDCFETWFVYYSGANEILKREIDLLLESSRTITVEDIDRIADIYLRSNTENQSDQIISDQIASELKEIISFISKSLGSTSLYQSELQSANERLESVVDDASLRVVVERLVTLTKTMAAQNSNLQHSLQLSQKNLKELQARLREARLASYTDSLTGLANRRHFDEAINGYFDECVESSAPLSLLVCDIDHFKKFNDTFGHLIGDQVLRLVAATIKDNINDTAFAARYGGEEFVIVLLQHALTDAIKIAERIREAISRRELVSRSTGKPLGKITISIGVAERRAEDDVRSLIHRADQCLYAAKERGRNQTVYSLQSQDGHKVIG